MAHQLILISSVTPLRDLQFLQITANSLHKGLLMEGVMKHLDDAGGTLIAYNIKDMHNIRLGFHIVCHWAHIKETTVAISMLRFISDKYIHDPVFGMQL